MAVASQPRPQRSGRRNPQRLPSGPSWWRCVHRRGVVCSRPSIAAREAPRQLRTRRRSDGVDGKSCEPWLCRVSQAWLRVRRPVMRNRPDIPTFVAFVPREPALCVDGKRKNPSSVTSRARSRWMEEKGWSDIFKGHGFLAHAMVRNPPGCGRLRTAARDSITPVCDRCGNSTVFDDLAVRAQTR
jgi:hypothetical protein